MPRVAVARQGIVVVLRRGPRGRVTDAPRALRVVICPVGDGQMAPAAARPRLEEVGHVDAPVPEEVRRPLLAEELPREQRAQNLPDLAAGHAQPAGQVREALVMVVVEAYGER